MRWLIDWNLLREVPTKQLWSPPYQLITTEPCIQPLITERKTNEH